MMWPYYGGGWNWLWMAGMMVVFWGAVIFAIAWVVRALTAQKTGVVDPITTLRKRLAAGEITQDEFEKTRKILQG